MLSHTACCTLVSLSADIYWFASPALNQIWKQHRIILVKSSCFSCPPPVALPRGTEKMKAFARGHTLTRAHCFPERAAHRAAPQPCPHWHQLAPRRLPVPGLWCHPSHLPAPAGAAAAHREGGVATSGCLLAISWCCTSLRQGEPARGGSQSPAACRGEKQKVASSHLCSPVPVVHQAQASQGENLGQGL